MSKQSFITILLTILMSMVGIISFAHDIAVKNTDGITIYYSWSNNKTELAVSYRGSGYIDECIGNVVIPKSVNYHGKTYPVTSIDDNAFYNCANMTSVTIPNSVTSIGKNAFNACFSLASVTIPNSVTSIGSDAFFYTEWYDNQPYGLVYAGKVAYTYKTYDRKSITSITIKDGTLGIADYAFSYFSGLTSVTIPNSVSSIGSKAFAGCSSLISVSIPNSVSSIGNDAFYETAWYNNQPEGLVYAGKVAYKYKGRMAYNTEIKLQDESLGIADDAFSDCIGLTSVIIPNSVTSIGSKAFYNCSDLISVTIFGNVKSIGSNAFDGCNGLLTIEFHCSTIGSHLSGLSSIKQIVIGNEVNFIGDNAFKECSELLTIIFHCPTISSWFSGLTSIKRIEIGDETTCISDYAFKDCFGLTSIIIGSGITSIGVDAFYNTNIIKTLWQTNTPPLGYSYAIGRVNYVSNERFDIKNQVVYKNLSSHFVVDGIRYVPVSPSDRTCDAIDCTYDASIENVNIGETVTYNGVTLTIKKVNPYTCYGNKYVKDLKLGLGGDIGDNAFYGCSNVEIVELGHNVASIGGYAFSDCSNLKSIVIPDAVSSLGSYAFQGCSAMTSARIGNGVGTIKESAFSGCSALTAITIPQTVTTIGNNVFYNCTSLAKFTIADSETTLTLGYNYNNSIINSIFSSCPLDYVYIGRDINYQTSSNYGYSPFYRNTTLREVKITDKETDISDNEFYGCTNLQTVTIGDGVTTIGNWAFSGCSSLKYFTFGTKLEDIGQEAFSDCTSLVQITSKAKRAPACGSQALEDINKWKCKLNVPKGYLSVYQAADQWMDFWFMEEGEYLPPLKGDVNSDGKVDKDDLNVLVEYVMGNKPNGVTDESADVNGDNKVNVNDVVTLISLLN